MSSRGLLNWGLIVLVLGLGWGVYTSMQPSPDEALPRVSNLQVDGVQQLRLIRGDVELRFERRGDDRWWMIKPVSVEANANMIQRMLSRFTLVSQVHYPAMELAYEKYGLERPQVKLDADGALLEFGRSNPLNGLRYLLFDNNLHMVAESDISFLQQAWPAYVSHRIVPTDADISMLDIEGLGRMSQESGEWQYAGDQSGVSIEQMQRLVERWQQASALAVSKADVDHFAGVKVRLSLVGNDAPLVFWVAQQGTEWLLMRPDLGLVYRLETGALLLSWPVQTERK